MLESEPESNPEPASEPELELKIEPASTTAEVTAEELYAAYKMDKVAADAKLTNKIIKVKGVVDRIVIEDIHDVYYIILTGAEKREEWSVRCTFARENVNKLNQLATGETVTVQGKYDGYRKNILMRDCDLVL